MDNLLYLIIPSPLLVRYFSLNKFFCHLFYERYKFSESFEIDVMLFVNYILIWILLIMAVWVVTLHKLVCSYQHCVWTFCHVCPENGGSMFLWNPG